MENILTTFNSFHPLTYNLLLMNSLTITFIFSISKFIHVVQLFTENQLTLHGQYQHIASFSSWSRKAAWIRALVNRVYKICSNETLLKDELKRILDFISWNGFLYKLSTKLINNPNHDLTTMKLTHDDLDNSTNNSPKILIHLPYLGKYGTRLTYSFINRITLLLKIKCTFVILWKTTNNNSFLSNKDKTSMRYQSSVVYEFTYPGCNCRYIGKTDRCLYTRLKEHSQHNKSEIFNHIINCEHFQHIKSMLELITLYHENNSTITCMLPELILNNSKIIDRSDQCLYCFLKNRLPYDGLN